MTGPAKRCALFVAALSIIAVVCVACAAPSSPLPSSGNNSGGVTGFHTPLPNNGQPTPAFPPFTMGAWPSNYSPGNNDTITVYVLCRVQDQSMLTPPKPPSQPLTITIVLSPIGGTYQGTTDADGLATITFTLNDPSSGQPVTVTASTTYNGQAYNAQTFFTPSPGAKASPSSNPGGGTPPPNPTGTAGLP